jgi:hypothetical protein
VCTLMVAIRRGKCRGTVMHLRRLNHRTRQVIPGEN